MTQTTRHLTAFILLVLGILLPSARLAAGDTYRARMLTNRGPVGDPVLNINIEIEDFSTPEENRTMQAVLNEQGFNAFLSAFRANSKGVIRVTGGRGWQVPINAAQVRYTAKGKKISLYMERQGWDSSTQMRIGINYFMVMELDIGDEGRNDGRLYEDAKITIDRDGWFVMEASESAPKPLLHVIEIVKGP